MLTIKIIQGDAFMALLKRFSFIMLFLSLVGCGGGDGGLDGGKEPVDPVDEITISMTISDNTVTADAPITVTAIAMQGNSALANQLVTFTLDNDALAYFSPNSATANTDSNGHATITLNAGNEAGAGTISASLVGGQGSSITFDSAGDGNTGGEPTIASIGLFASSQQLASSGAQEVVLTALVKDVDNNLIQGATIEFSADSGAIQVTKAVTEADGKATATLTTELDKSNRVITVTATNEDISDTVNVQVTGTSVNITGSTSLATNDENSFIIKLLDSDGNDIADTIVDVSLSNSSTTAPAGDVASITLPESVKTDFNGQATIKVTGTSGGTNSIIVSALGANDSQDVAVQADSFLFTSFDNNIAPAVNPVNTPIPDVFLSNSAEITLTWLRSGQVVADGTVVNFTTTRGTLEAASAVTKDGQVTAVVSSNNAGKALVTFTGIEGEIALENQLEFEFIAETPATIVAQASPSSIGPNGQKSTISVVVKDANGNLVKNQTVDFNLSDVSNGSIFPASAVTDSNGSASTVYTSSSVSAADSVAIEAKIDLENGSSISDTVALTVSDRELFISLGTGNSVQIIDDTTYNKQYSVFVTDADSTPRADVNLTISAVPTSFRKGFWYAVVDDAGKFKFWGAETVESCNNEDLNRDGIMDTGEDVNGNGMLTPGNVVGAIGEVTTDENGRAVIDIMYPKSDGSWLDVELVAKTRVTGTESQAMVHFTLPTASVDVNDEDIAPPVENIPNDFYSHRSPYGSGKGCDNID